MKKVCGKCKKEHDGSFGSGRFCSRACANTRSPSEATKNKIRVSVRRHLENNPKPSKPKPKHICEKCGNEFRAYIRKDRKKYCNQCKRQVVRGIENPKSLLVFSKRTVSKILKRANKCCTICGWNKARCDIHHIRERSKGGTDEHTNLIIICPNCHRVIGEGKCELTTSQLLELSIANTFKDWRVYYHRDKKYKLISALA